MTRRRSPGLNPDTVTYLPSVRQEKFQHGTEETFEVCFERFSAAGSRAAGTTVVGEMSLADLIRLHQEVGEAIRKISYSASGLTQAKDPATVEVSGGGSPLRGEERETHE